MYWSLPPLSLLDAVVPRLMADLPMTPALRALLFESREPLLVCLYVGVPIAFLAVLGLAAGGRRALFAAALSALLLVLALCGHTPLPPVLYRVPSIGLWHFPTKSVMPASLFASLLAGAGVDVCRAAWSPLVRRRGLIVSTLAGLAAAAFLAAALWAGRGPAPLAPWVEA